MNGMIQERVCLPPSPPLHLHPHLRREGIHPDIVRADAQLGERPEGVSEVLRLEILTKSKGEGMPCGGGGVKAHMSQSLYLFELRTPKPTQG